MGSVRQRLDASTLFCGEGSGLRASALAHPLAAAPAQSVRHDRALVLEGASRLLPAPLFVADSLRTLLRALSTPSPSTTDTGHSALCCLLPCPASRRAPFEHAPRPTLSFGLERTGSLALRPGSHLVLSSGTVGVTTDQHPACLICRGRISIALCRTRSPQLRPPALSKGTTATALQLKTRTSTRLHRSILTKLNTSAT